MESVQQNIMYDLQYMPLSFGRLVFPFFVCSPLTVFFLFLSSGNYFSNAIYLAKSGEEQHVLFFTFRNALVFELLMQSCYSGCLLII